MDKNVRRVVHSSKKTGGRDDWESPNDFYQMLNRIYLFTLDPAASKQNAKCAKYYTVDDDGLSKDWQGESVYINPPYSQNKKWVSKALFEASKPETTVVVLIPARTDTVFWHDYIMKATKVHFVRGRLTFELNGKPILDAKGRPMPAPFPSAVAVFQNSPCHSPAFSAIGRK